MNYMGYVASDGIGRWSQMISTKDVDGGGRGLLHEETEKSWKPPLGQSVTLPWFEAGISRIELKK
jgi:hypothetical protein